jgi:hypothetical protein
VTDERHKVMIFRRNPRVIANACLTCGLSLVSCHGEVEYEARRCCPDCTHPTFLPTADPNSQP